MTPSQVPVGSYHLHFGLAEGQSFFIDGKIEVVFVASSADARVAKVRALYHESDWRGAVVGPCDAYLRLGCRFHVGQGIWCEVMHNRGDMARIGVVLPRQIRQVMRRDVTEAIAQVNAGPAALCPECGSEPAALGAPQP